MSILSLQSSVAYGHVGNSAVVFALRRLGHEVWPIDTVRFSNHPGHGRHRGRLTAPEEAEEIIAGLAEVGAVAAADGVLSGYLGQAAMGRVLEDLIARVRQARPQASTCIDPVMGDHDRGLYVDDRLIAFFRERAIGLADILTPNHFELEVLAGRKLPAIGDIVSAARAIAKAGPATLLVSSVPADGDSSGIATLAVERHGPVWQVTTPRLAHPAHGAGDLLAALFFAHRLGGSPVDRALADAVSQVFAVIAATAAAGSRELRLVAAQGDLARPPIRYPAVPLAEKSVPSVAK